MARIQVLESTAPDAEAAPGKAVSTEIAGEKPAPEVSTEPGTEQGAVNKGGRPRIPIEKKATPSPPHRKYDTEASRGRQPADFFRWWSSLDPVFHRRLMAYVYRTWPVIQYEVPTKSGVRLSRQQAKVSGEDPILSIEDLKHRFGSGNYYIHLNDASNTNKTIASCTITGIREMEDHPPILPNLEWLDMDDPSNQSYIAGLRMKGVKFPGDSPEGDGEMAAGIDRLATTVERLTLDRTQHDQGQGRDRKKEVEDEATGMKAVVQVMSDAAQKGSKILSDAVAESNKIAAKGQDPSAMISLVKEIFEMAKPSQSSPSPGVDLAALMAPVVEALKTSREESLELKRQVADLQKAQLETLKEMIQNGKQQQPEPPKPVSLKDTLKEMAEARDGLKDLLGIEEPDEKEIVKTSDKDPIWARLLLAGVNMFGSSLPAIAYNLALAKGAPGAPIRPEAQPTVNPDGTLALPPGGEGMGADNELAGFLAQIRAPLIRSVANNIPGGDFAGLLTEWTGDPLIHAQLKEQGKEGVMGMLASDAHIKQLMDRLPQRFSVFVDEFLAWDPNAAEEEDVEDGAEGGETDGEERKEEA